MVKITERFYMNSTPNSYVLQERTEIKDTESQNFGKVVFRDLGYYTSLDSLLKGVQKILLREYLSKSVENSLNDLLAEIKRTNELLKDLHV